MNNFPIIDLETFRAKEGLAASKSTPRATTPSPLLSPSNSFIVQKLDGDVQWDQLVKAVNRPLVINDLDFTDLQSEEDADLMQCLGDGPGPAPPNPLLGPPPPPPPLPPTANQEPTQNGGPPPPPPGPPPLPPSANKGTKLNGVPPPPPTWVKRNQHHQQEKVCSFQKLILYSKYHTDGPRRFGTGRFILDVNQNDKNVYINLSLVTSAHHNRQSSLCQLSHYEPSLVS